MCLPALPYNDFVPANAGGQRYAAHWTGDNVSSWEHYRMNFPMIVNMGLSGYAIAGTILFVPHPLISTL